MAGRFLVSLLIYGFCLVASILVLKTFANDKFDLAVLLGVLNSSFALFYFWERLSFDKSNQARALKTKRLDELRGEIIAASELALASNQNGPLVRLQVTRILGEVECLDECNFISKSLLKSAVRFLNNLSAISELTPRSSKTKRANLMQSYAVAEQNLMGDFYADRSKVDRSAK